MLKELTKIILPLFLLSFFISCKKETENPDFLSLQDYYPVEIGKTWTYRLDSTQTAPFGTALIKKYYQAKDSVESSFTDNSGRPSFRVFRFLRDTSGIQPWQFDHAYSITFIQNGVEVIDNNLRFIKLVKPIRESIGWKGNAYIDTKSASSTVKYMDEWNYEYQNINQPFIVRKGEILNTITILQQDETLGNPDPDSYQQRDYSIEVYAKGIGLIYKDFLHTVWQPTPPPSKYEDDSHGIQLNLIDYK